MGICFTRCAFFLQSRCVIIFPCIDYCCTCTGCCFLLRLGFIGDEYKVARKILLRNFTGSSAFKSTPKAKEVE